MYTAQRFCLNARRQAWCVPLLVVLEAVLLGMELRRKERCAVAALGQRHELFSIAVDICGKHTPQRTQPRIALDGRRRDGHVVKIGGHGRRAQRVQHILRNQRR